MIPPPGLDHGTRSNHCRFVHEGMLAVSWDGRVAPCLSLLYAHPEQSTATGRRFTTSLWGMWMSVRWSRSGATRLTATFGVGCGPSNSRPVWFAAAARRRTPMKRIAMAARFPVQRVPMGAGHRRVPVTFFAD